MVASGARDRDMNTPEISIELPLLGGLGDDERRQQANFAEARRHVRRANYENPDTCLCFRNCVCLVYVSAVVWTALTIVNAEEQNSKEALHLDVVLGLLGFGVPTAFLAFEKFVDFVRPSLQILVLCILAGTTIVPVLAFGLFLLMGVCPTADAAFCALMHLDGLILTVVGLVGSVWAQDTYAALLVSIQ
jgi:hypothetical protein